MKFVIIFTSLLLSVNIFPQDKMSFEFDYARFRFDTTSNYIEFYYSFNQSSLTVKHSDTLDYTQGILHITIQDTLTGESVVDRDWMITHPVFDVNKLDNSLVGVIGFKLNNGVYKCNIIGKDAVEDGVSRSITEFIKIKPFKSMELAIADIQLASNIISGSDNTSSIFYKNDFEIMPVPAATFSEQQPVLFYYTEIYNIISSPGNSGFNLNENIYNSKGQTVFQKTKAVSRTYDSIVEVGTVMTYKLPTDTYNLVLSLIDSATNSVISSSKKFFVYNPSVEYVDTFHTKSQNLTAGMFGVMSEEELDDFFSKSKYLATAPELDKYSVLKTVDGKREFLTSFWKARDEDPSDEVNNNLREYMKRIKIADERFETFSKEGWQTDRGRVYLMCGEPSEIERHPNESGSRPYEIWIYNDIEGGVQFVFGDITGFSQYTLLHSTKRGEYKDENWQRRLVVR